MAAIIIGALFVFLLVENNENIFDNLKWGSDDVSSTKIALGDCADIDFKGYYSNGTVFATSYKDVAIEWDIYNPDFEDLYVPLTVLAALKWNDTAPEGYDEYIYIPMYGFGFMENIIGKEEGKSYKLGPIPPEKGFGKLIQINDTVDIDVDPMYSMYGLFSMHETLVDIIHDAPLESIPYDYLPYVTSDTTDIYVFKDVTYDVGDKKTLYLSWTDATIVTSVNDTHICWKTSPSEDQMSNFTWIQQSALTGEMTTFPENCSNAFVNEEDNRIIVTHTPETGQKLYVTNVIQYSTVEYTVVGLTGDKINCSYIDYEGNTSYAEFSRFSNVTLNECESLLREYPVGYLEDLFVVYRMFDHSMQYGIGTGAGEDLYFDIEVKHPK